MFRGFHVVPFQPFALFTNFYSRFNYNTLNYVSFTCSSLFSPNLMFYNRQPKITSIHQSYFVIIFLFAISNFQCLATFSVKGLQVYIFAKKTLLCKKVFV